MFCYEDYTKRLIDLKLPKFGIYANLSGHIPELHDKITNAPGSFTQTIAGIENLLKYNVNVEIRIVINRINYKFLPQIAEYLSIKFPNIPTIAFIAMNIVGNARINAKKVSIRYDEMVPYLERALDIILAKKINTRLYSFPLCVLKQKYRKFAKRIIFYKDKVQFLPQCEYCKCRKMCFGIWKSYIKEINDGEFKAIN
jgi:MoaA/NifB/PqqE/SkfB family radical SAM enzyme